MRIHADPDPQPWFVLCGNLLNSYHMELLGQSPSPRLKLGLGGSSWPGWWMGEENRLGNRELVSSLPATDNPRLFFISADTGYECWISGNQPHSQHWPENLYLPVLEHVFLQEQEMLSIPDMLYPATLNSVFRNIRRAGYQTNQYPLSGALLLSTYCSCIKDK